MFYNRAMISAVSKLTEGNRMVIPATIRKRLGLQIGDAVTLVLDDDGAVRLLTQTESVRRAQELVRQYIPAERKLVDELIAERRQEAVPEQP